MLATGGGTSDKRLCFWDCNENKLLDSIDTESQICSILWSEDYKELVTSHGYAENQLTIWNYRTKTVVSKIPAHEKRILYTTLSPDETTVATAAGDENLKFWNIFPKKKKAPATSKSIDKNAIVR